MASPFDDAPQGEDPMLWFKAEQRKRALERGYPLAGQQQQQPAPQPPPTSAPDIMTLLSRFLHPGSQTSPATPKRNREGVEDETDMSR